MKIVLNAWSHDNGNLAKFILKSYEKYLVNTKELSKKLWLDIPFGDLYVTLLPFGRVEVII